MNAPTKSNKIKSWTHHLRFFVRDVSNFLGKIFKVKELNGGCSNNDFTEE